MVQDFPVLVRRFRPIVNTEIGFSVGAYHRDSKVREFVCRAPASSPRRASCGSLWYKLRAARARGTVDAVNESVGREFLIQFVENFFVLPSSPSRASMYAAPVLAFRSSDSAVPVYDDRATDERNELLERI
jgi:hypothetical protein